MLVTGQKILTPQCHQVFCGMLSRIAQFADILRDSKQQVAKVRQGHTPHVLQSRDKHAQEEHACQQT